MLRQVIRRLKPIDTDPIDQKKGQPNVLSYGYPQHEIRGLKPTDNDPIDLR